MHDKISAEDQALLDKFLADNKMFLGPDPEIMRNHGVAPRSEAEDAILSKGFDAHRAHHIRGLVNAALSDKPETINEDAYGDGWLFVVEAEEPEQANELLGPDDYAELLEDDDH